MVSTANSAIGTSISDLLGHTNVGGGALGLRRFPLANVLAQISAVAGSTPAQIFATVAQAQATLNYDPYTMAWVTDDPVVANRGVYQKSGSSGLGFWSKLAELPYSFLFATSVGGTGNAITATLDYQYSPVTTLIGVTLVNTNSGPATIAFNGGAALAIKTSSQNDPPPGSLLPNMTISGYIVGGTFTLMSDLATSALYTATSNARDDAETFRDESEDFANDAAASAASAVAVSNAYPRVNRSAMKALNTTTFKTAYLTESGVEAIYDWDADWPKELCSAETAEIRYISPNLAANGAWVRRIDLNPDDYAAFSRVKRKIEAGQNSVIVVLGDSTGNASTEWVYLFATWLGARYPTMDVQYYLWNSGTEDYDAFTTISNGSGSNTIKIYNASVSGYNLISWIGVRLTKALINVSNVDCIITNAGLNVSGLNDQKQQRRSMIDAAQTIAMYKPATSIAMFLQQPLTDSTLMNKVTAAQRQTATLMPGLSLMDLHSILVDGGKPTALYAGGDNTHLASSGLMLPERVIERAFVAASYEDPKVDPLCWFDTARAANILYNGAFDKSGTYYTGWTQSGTGTFTQDTSEKYTGKTSSAKIVSTNTARYEQTFDSAQLAAVRGRFISMLARLKVTAGGPAHAGLISLNWVDSVSGTSGTEENFRFNAGDGAGGYRLACIDNFYVPIFATSVVARLYGSANSTGATINIDEALVYFGNGRPVSDLLAG